MAVSTVHHQESSISRYTYHVFLSFRGADTRKNFTDHLYMALVQAGIHTFRDDDEIERGENIRDKIERALQESKIFIIVFSKNYASSTWCLNELVKIMEHRKFSKHIVLPIFYDVNPSQVKKQTGSFAEAFATHEESFKSEMDMVQRWRAALREVADLGGMLLEDRHESQFIQDIITQVENKLHRTTLHVPPYLVGIDFLVTRISWWLGDESNKVGIATICGIGGIGKTTIAKVVYNLNVQRFESCSFLANVRETTEERNGLVHLQRQLISDILKGKAKKIYNSDDGIIKIKEAIRRRRVLLVLDDVDDSEKITEIIGAKIPFHPGSKIIITSRHRCLLSDPFIRHMFDLEASSSYGDLCKVFEVKELAFNESLQLFDWYAFGQNDPIDSYMEYAKSIVNHCGGLPLALQVLGSSLSGKSINVWKSALEKLKAIPDSKIQKILRISYDSLEDDHDKNLFLDIACVFAGKDKDYTTTILDGCDYYTAIGIENLINRSLLVVNEKNKLMMHQMIRDVGRNIIRQESPNLGKRSRLWHKDAFDALKEKIGTKTIKCLTIDLQRLLEEKYGKIVANHSKNSFLMSNEVDIEIDAFAKMQRLKLLQLDYVKLKGDYRDFPRSLIWLSWHGFPQEYLPTNLDISKLVVLEMLNSSLKRVWNDTKYFLPNLKILNLSHSHDLLKILNLSCLHSLERLMLKDCTKLIEVDQSIGEIKTLTILNLKGCKSLRKLPKTIGSLECLEELILSGCSTLDDMPRDLQNMKSLRVLNLDGTAICESNSWLSWLSLKRSKELGFFWASLPCSLVKLSLESCRLSDDAMPADLSYLPSLKSLNLSRNPIRSLPKSISRLRKLDELLLTCCKDLQWLPKLPINLSGLRMKMYQSMYSYASLSLLLSLKRFILFGCEKLTEIEGVFKFEPFENFEVEEIKCLFNMDSISSIQLQVYNYLTDTKMITTPQVFHEGGITSCFVSESEVPISFEHRCKGPKISFSLPQNPGEKVSWLNLCIKYSLVSDEIFEFLPSVYIVNETKELVWAYFSSFIGIPETKSDTILWVIHWPVKDYQLENGDLVSCKLISSGLEIKEFGVTYVAEKKDTHEDDSRLYYQGNEDIWRKIKVKVNEELLNLGSSGNVKVQIYNYFEEPIIVASPQVLYDCGIISMFVPYDFACWGRYSHHVIGNKVSFTVARSSSQQICWINFMVALVAEDDQIFDFLSRIEIVNETKSTTWTYHRRFTGIPKAKNALYWLSSWRFMGEDGDRVSFTVFSDLYVKECVIDLIYESDDNLLHKCNSTYEHSPATSAIFRWLFPVFVYLLFMSQRSLYRIQCLDK
ncbi:disease resistance protein TAO1-like [Herrania umbratica]|uniref:ADP-ribosyl cyclase/cyclic ADP-ribose hydrolase n=1 Tax=Herrania umbratica TaxID=108875 RepID=A0A6J1A4M3_9ROSI|nr:disease resistance protein TAO1-like [Herrania umbratica]